MQCKRNSSHFSHFRYNSLQGAHYGAIPRKQVNAQKLSRKALALYGFTLMELMVSIVVLLAIMIAVSRIFSVTSKVAAIGTATSSTLQQAIAIEQQLREDIAKISPEGFFVIRSVAVANNVRGDYDLLDPSQDASAIIRCDQLIFLIEAVASPMVFNGSSPGTNGGTNFAGQGCSAMVYYGHGLQFPRLDGIAEDEYGAPISNESSDPVLFPSSTQQVVTPWYEGMVSFQSRIYSDSQAERFNVVDGGSGFAAGSQPNPEDWILCRQLVVLADDDDNSPRDTSKTIYLSSGTYSPGALSARSIFPWDPRVEPGETIPQIQHGRVDTAATHLADIRESVLQWEEGASTSEDRVWQGGFLGNTNQTSDNIDQQELIASLMYWPRVEPVPPTLDRADQAMRVAAIAQGCVTFQVEWTYDEGVGEATDASGQWFPGFNYADQWQQPWWGGSTRNDEYDYEIDFNTLQDFYDQATGLPWDGMHTQDDPFEVHDSDLDDDDSEFADVAAWSIDPWFIERTFVEGEGPSLAPVPTVEGVTDDGISEYWAIFGYNNAYPFLENGLDFVNEYSDNSNADDGDVADGGWDNGDQAGNVVWRYTPRPTAIKITLRLQDPDDRLGAGWTYQFVVNIPERK